MCDQKTTEEKRAEAALETVLNAVHKQYISINDQDRKSNGDHFRTVLDHLVELMKQEDSLFKAIYSRLSGAGSYYDGLKVGKPEEYDLDFVMRLPINYKDVIVDDNGKVSPAFTKVKITKATMDILRQHPHWSSQYRFMDSWRDGDGYLLQSKFLQWMEGLVNKALNRLERKEANCYELVIQDPDGSKETRYLISLTKSGPAMTFNITIAGNVKVDVDCVPMIEFTHPKWPPCHVRKLSSQLATKRTSWYIVPKPKKKDADGTLWRFAFHEQEREMISHKGVLKPVCRLLKKFRDTNFCKIASYYLKTLFLWELDSQSSAFWEQKQGAIFMHMLKIFHDNLEKGSIKYYWDDRYDLTEGLKDMYKINIHTRMKIIIADIEKNVQSCPLVVAKYILSNEEYENLETPAISLKAASPLAASPSSVSVQGTLKKEPQQKPEPQAGSEAVCTKLDKMMALLQKLSNKVDKLTDTVNQLRDENTILRDQLRLVQRQNHFNTLTAPETDLMLQAAHAFSNAHL